jgi:UDP-N-acetylglucosamine 4,6-dehydratase
MTMAQALDFVLDALRDMQGREIYVPRLPSAYVTDIARAIYPEADLKHIGIRDGEKLHETLLTKDEARFAYGDANRFVIAPHIKSDLPSAFEYRSDTNDWWLNTEDLKELIRLV